MHVGRPWAEWDIGETFHVYDVATRTGTDLYASGSAPGCGISCGTVWRSLDGGATWAVSYQDTTTDTSVHGGLRCFNMAAYQQRVYVSCTTGNYVTADGADWTESPVALASPDATVVFDGRLVGPLGTRLYAYDGTDLEEVMDQRPLAAAVDGRWLYAMTSESIYRTDSLDTLISLLGLIRINPPQWERVADTPAGATSFTVLDAYAYVGTDDSRLLRRQVPVS